MYVERGISGEFDSMRRLYGIVAIVGPRQAGKTTFLKEHSKGDRTVYLLFDDPDIRELFNLDIKRFENQYLENGKTFILDEIQTADNPGQKLKYLADTGKRLWVSSSSEMLLARSVLSWLVGRVGIIRVYPFSFEEFLRVKGHKELTEAMRARDIEEHMRYGGYPGIVIAEMQGDKEMMLRNLFDTMVFKDMAQTFGIEDIGALQKLAKFLSHYIGNAIEYASMSRNLGLSFQSLKKYMDAMEKSYLITLINPFYTNKLKEITKQQKVYFVDTGMRNSVANEFGVPEEAKGKLFENYVLMELVKAKYEVKYWQTKGRAEVDFVVEKGNMPIPIEIKLHANGGIEKSMHSFIASYKPKAGFVVYLEGHPKSIESSGCTVKFLDSRQLITELDRL
jgi:predicted AAA+ superfamily ATPase